MKYLALSLTLCIAHSIGSQNDDQAYIRTFFDEALVKRQSYHWLKDLCAIGPRLSGSENASHAIEWVKSVMDTCGFDSVYLQPVMVPHWERGEPEQAMIIDSRGNSYPLSVLAVGGSIATPKEGLIGQVLEVKSLFELDEMPEEDVRGKIVFYNLEFDQTNIATGASYGANVSVRSQGATKAARKGAIASIIRSVTSAQDDIPHTGTGHYEAGVDSIPAAALGVKSAQFLHQLLQIDPLARVHLKIASRWYPDALSYNVIAELRGSEYPDEIIVVGGHLDSWDVTVGAHDDGAGCMHALGALKLLVDSEIQPDRTVRAVMFINEENGLRGGIEYANQAVKQGWKHVAAIESDAGGYSPRGFGVSADEEQLRKLESWLDLFPLNTISYMKKGGGGADIGPLHRETGTPMLGLQVDGQKMFDVHHSSKDTFESVHPRELELGTASLATIIYLISKYGL